MLARVLSMLICPSAQPLPLIPLMALALALSLLCGYTEDSGPGFCIGPFFV